ncbi:MAG: hypothetical protein EB084_13540 [Proteobacteria bacterium]|nr:hypothetical protein [Pseudomonadota bacterium]
MVTVRSPGDPWVFDGSPDDPSSLTLSHRAGGVQIAFRVTDNKAHLDALSAAAVLESRMMQRADAAGRHFAMPRRCTLAGVPASRFSEEHLIHDAIIHRTEYTVAPLGDRCLVVAVSGSPQKLEGLSADIRKTLEGVRKVSRFEAPSTSSGR